ncbi:autotransporter outer membrane beta-barrel domain-containing protein [Brucella sp. 21LCYQ03]|nr:autotransporter outer membrane beta-barrel domain-containing protein [Brucella sp. 21LCYQ03]
MSATTSQNAEIVVDTWTGSTNTDWFTGSNWASGSVPLVGSVKISGTTAATSPIIDGRAAQADYLTIGSGADDVLKSGGLTIRNGGTLKLGGASLDNLDTKTSFISGSDPTVTVTGKGSKLTVDSYLNIGSTENSEDKGNGHLNILDGAQASVYGLDIGSASSQSTLKVSGIGSELTVGNGGLSLGWGSGNSIIEVTDGGKIVGPIGDFRNASLTVSGQGSLVSLSVVKNLVSKSVPSQINVFDGATFELTGIGSYRFAGPTMISGVGSILDNKSTDAVFVIANDDDSSQSSLTVSNGGTFKSQTHVTVGVGVYAGALNIGAAPADAAAAPGNVIIQGGLSVLPRGSINFNHTSDHYVFENTISGITGGAINQISGTTILTADSDFSGTVTITGGTLQFGDNGVTGSLGSGGIVTGTDAVHKGTLAFAHSGTSTYDKNITGTGSVKFTGSGTTILTGNNTYTGGTVFAGGEISVSDDQKLGNVEGGLTFDGATLKVVGTSMTSTTRNINWGAGGGSFDIADADNTFTVSQNLETGGSLAKLGGGTLILTGDNTYIGGTTVSAGRLQVGDGHEKGGITGNALIATDSTLAFNRSGAVNFDGKISGTGVLDQMGSGALTLSGDNSGFTGSTMVSNGTLVVNGTLGGAVEVASGTYLGGNGSIKGNVTLAPGSASLMGREDQTLTFEHDLTLVAGSNVNVMLGGSTTQGLFDVHGNLTLAGTLNVTDMGSFGPGSYRIFDYDGTLTDNHMLIGSVPGGDTSNMAIETKVAHRVSLVNTAGVTVNFWNGDDPAKHGNGLINGGNGIWNKANEDWTDKDVQFALKWTTGQFAVFTGTAGTVTVDDSGGSVSTSGMQFATDGYRVEGNAIILAGDTTPIIRVDKNVTATIAAELQGSHGLQKTDFGRLVLTGANHYTGGTTVNEGILQLGDGAASGSIDGDVVLARTAYGYGTLAFDRADAISFKGAISGEGAVLQQGKGTTTFAGNNSFSGGLTILSGTAQAGIADNAFGSSRLTIDTGATADLNNFNTTVQGLLDGKDGGGTVALGSATLTLNQDFDSIFTGTFSGTGGVVKNGAGSLTLSGTSSYGGNTQLNDGILKQGAKGAFSGASAYSVSSGSTLALNGFDTSMTALSNNGLTDFGGTGGTVLNITKNYNGNGGTLVLSAMLGDDNSKTDILKIGGDTSGTSTVKIINRGGIGAHTNEGIRIIEVAGQSNGSFNLAGDYTTKDGQQAVVAGAYAYSLHEGGVSTPSDGDWYLRSELKDGTGPIINPGVPLYQGVIAAMQTLNKLPTLQQRVGNRYWDGAANPLIAQGADAIGTPLVSAADAGSVIDQRGIWGRVEGAHSHFEPNNSDMRQDINTYLMQAGVDGQFYEGETGKLIGGITGQYGNAHSDISSAQSDGDVETQAWSLGATLTWYGDRGFYVDTQAQANWYDNDFNSTTANKSLANGRKGFGYALSAEAGQRIDLNNNWSLTPQAQLTWSSISLNSFNDTFGAAVDLGDGDSLTGRIGISADYRNAWRDADGTLSRVNLYSIANLHREMLGDVSVKVAGDKFNTENDKTWGGVGVGGTYAWADDKYAVYGEGSVNTSLNTFANSYSLKATAGFRIKW